MRCGAGLSWSRRHAPTDLHHAPCELVAHRWPDQRQIEAAAVERRQLLGADQLVDQVGID
jgi:hypothetical protein